MSSSRRTPPGSLLFFVGRLALISRLLTSTPPGAVSAQDEKATAPASQDGWSGGADRKLMTSSGDETVPGSGESQSWESRDEKETTSPSKHDTEESDVKEPASGPAANEKKEGSDVGNDAKATHDSDASQSGKSGGGSSGQWLPAHATFYGDVTASETMGGACGFGNLSGSGYGTDTVAPSKTLFKKGFSCGGCYEIRCRESPHCLPGGSSVTVTATNLCPPNWAQDSNDGGWCNLPRQHFDMAKPAFTKIADWHAGIVPVHYRRVACVKKGGVRFTFQGNDYWLLVFVMNVGADGDVAGLAVKGAKTDWIPMTHNWGASYQAFESLGGQSLSFKVTSYSSKKTLPCSDVAPPDWTVGLTYEATVNFN